VDELARDGPDEVPFLTQRLGSNKNLRGQDRFSDLSVLDHVPGEALPSVGPGRGIEFEIG
jgi:hypothetical protein